MSNMGSIGDFVEVGTLASLAAASAGVSIPGAMTPEEQEREARILMRKQNSVIRRGGFVSGKEKNSLSRHVRSLQGGTGDLPLLTKTPQRELSVGRNDPCPCGSGKKFKKCCIGDLG